VKHLYTRIYLAFVLMLAVFFVASALLFHLGPGRPGERDLLNGMALLTEAALSDRTGSEAHLAPLADRLGADFALFASDGRLELATSGGFVPGPRPEALDHHWVRQRRARGAPAAALRWSDGRWLVARFRRPSGRGPFHLGNLGLLAGILALAAWPVARSITRRLEGLERGVDRIGAGELGTRIPVDGRDEVARLARATNRAAERLETLVDGQRTLLASASHELRSPLARLRMAAELLADASTRDPERRARLRDDVARDVAVLDRAVESLLQGSRLDLAEALGDHTVDLLALCAEEAVPFDARVSGSGDALLRGDETSLRSLVRNLLENAARHAPGVPAEITVLPADDGALRLAVADRGPGIPEPERESVFEAFRRGARTTPGTGSGLGLALVRRIAEHHGGRVSVEAREGGGAVFVVQLPRRGD